MLQEKWFPAPARALTTIAVVVILASAAWAGPKYKVLHAFTGGKDGGGLWGSLLVDNQGNIYGTTVAGGPKGKGGTVFKLTRQANDTWAEAILYNFCSKPECKDGGGSSAGLIFDREGNLYGTTMDGGGPYTTGTVFEMKPGSNGWIFSTIHRFGRNDPANGPYGGVVVDQLGNLYGVGGWAFELTLIHDHWKETLIHAFSCQHSGGCVVLDHPILDTTGNLYGTTERGGTRAAGTVYQLRHTSDGWKESVLHDFPSFHNDGQVPGVGALVSDDSRNLYGTTDQGGSNTCVDVGCGTVFKLTPGSNGDWKETILYNFAGNAKGSGPGGGVVRDGAGNLYGTTVYGGTTSCDCGVVYKLAPNSKGKWKYTVLHRFTGYDGAQPDANLILDSKGNLYGTTATGGASGAGVAFELIP
jgi:uncharacterized repeat protein (TIGR03803 family)